MLQKYRIFVYIRRNTLMCVILHHITIGLKLLLIRVVCTDEINVNSLYWRTNKATVAFYAFTFPIYFLFLNWRTVSFKRQHLSALPFLSPSSREPAGKSAACQKWVTNMKICKCEFHEAWCSFHAMYFWPLKHCEYLASTPHVVHLIPVAITARVQL